LAVQCAKNSTVEEQWLSVEAKKMVSRISHRGFLSLTQIDSFKEFSLGCVRLPIVDEADGTQPIYSENGKIILVFNGEIYNYKVLREEYLFKNRFKTSSDTEVLANLLEAYGIEITLSIVEGMFAFIAYDLVDKKYFIARDFIGIKPIYFLDHQSFFFAASEVKAFERNLECIQELPPQHYYDSQNGIKKWEIPGSNTDAPLQKLISKSVKEQVNTHLPLAVFLSGGIDSSIICYEANQYHSNVTAFTIGKKNSDDMMNAKRLCDYFNFKFEPIFISEEEILDAIEETIFCIESFEPNHVRAGRNHDILFNN